jgi:hypothetical protein
VVTVTGDYVPAPAPVCGGDAVFAVASVR